MDRISAASCYVACVHVRMQLTCPCSGWALRVCVCAQASGPGGNGCGKPLQTPLKRFKSRDPGGGWYDNTPPRGAFVLKRFKCPFMHSGYERAHTGAHRVLVVSRRVVVSSLSSLEVLECFFSSSSRACRILCKRSMQTASPLNAPRTTLEP